VSLRSAILLSVLAVGAIPTAHAEEPEREPRWHDGIDVRLNGDLKTFFTATFPYDHVLMPDAPGGQGAFDHRTKLAVDGGDWAFEAHHTVTLFTGVSGGAPTSGGLGTNTGVGLQAPELVDLTWVPFDEDLTLQTRVDRLSLAYRPDGMGLTVGRQPVTFGNAAVFTPLDLVNPFNPAVIDQEYKPGVDAVRLDLYAGFATKLTLVGAWAGSLDVEGLIAAAYGQTTVGVTDLGLFAGSVRGDAVVGTSVATSIGPIGVTSDVALTAPRTIGEDPESPFVRGTLGMLWRPGPNTTITAEAYIQTLGATDPDGYIAEASDPRFTRGEVWLMGVAYVAVAASQQITPTLTGSVAAISNVLDPSAFVAPTVSWSVANNVDFAIGGFVGVGARPESIELVDLLGPDGLPKPPAEQTYLRSEFGTYPGVAFAQARIYF
jgi:hypothetical protein